MNIIKRDGTIKKFDKERISLSIKKAYEEVYNGNMDVYNREINTILDKIFNEEFNNKQFMEVEELQDIIINILLKVNKKVANSYIDYREMRTRVRESKNNLMKSVEGILNLTNKEVLEENSNKQSLLNSTQRDLMAGEVSKVIARQIIPKHLINAHDNGEIKIHDMDYFANPMHNCELINLKDMFTNGTVINKKMIETPKSLRTAMTVATQVLAQVASSQYGI